MAEQINTLQEVLEAFASEKQQLDDTIHRHPIRLAALVAGGTTTAFIVSCLLASAPVIETLACGIALGPVIFGLFMLAYRFGGAQLFPESLGPAARAAKPVRAASTPEPPTDDWAPRRTLKAIAAAALGIFLVGATLASGAQARTSCSYLGAPANVLSVVVRGEAAADEFASAEIKRKRQEITVNEFQERPQPCAGGTPTVLNVDTINVLLLGDLTAADIRLGGGPFAPGATPEAVGASEIEIRITGRSAQASVVGTSRADEFHWGPGGTTPGLNLNPRSAGDRDVDVTIQDFDSFLVAEGGAGNDTIIGQPGARIPDGAFSQGGRGNDLLRAPRSGAIVEGGPGNDEIAGAGGYDLIEGGAGNDRVTGGGGPDEITGGPGRDRLFGGAGRDFIKSRDSARDTVRCGPGRDRATADRRDRVRGCERISGR